MIGFFLIFIAFVVTVLSAISFFNSLRSLKVTSDKRTSGTTLYFAAFAFIMGAVVYLLVLILTDQFQYANVFGYSSKELPLLYKLSALWAGQDGSFLLWVFLHSLLGVVLLSKRQISDCMIAVHAAIQTMLLVILIIKSPFSLLPTKLPDGAGLNLLLQDPWMIVHPPIVFLGYASLGIPFSYAISSLITGDHRNWLRPALAWSLLSWGLLGAGIFVGGYWAYNVLGWGGYWAWDPVENSSLIPWLICGAQVHLLFIALKRQPVIKVACLATLFSFIMVLYGTFLTRSGILSNFSTHSFTNEGVGGLLAVMVMVALSLALIVLTVKWPLLPSGRFYESVRSADCMVFVGTAIMAILAAVTAIGTSTPLVTMLLGHPYSLQNSFYNNMVLPLAGVLLFTVILAGMFSLPANAKRSLTIAVTVLLGITGGELIRHYGVDHLLAESIIGLACSAFIVSLLAYSRNLMAGITHAGVALLIIGIIASSMGSRTVVTNLKKGESEMVFGRQIAYHGSADLSASRNFIQTFAVGKSATEVPAYTKLGNNNKPVVREPAIYHELLGDLYITPAFVQDTQQRELELVKGIEMIDNGLALKLIRYGISTTNPSQRGVYALLEMSENGKAESVKLVLNYVAGEFHAVPMVALNKYQVSLTGLNLAQEKVTLSIMNPLQEDGNIETEISYKPLIGLVWLGAFIIAAGTTISGLRRLTMLKSAGDYSTRLSPLSRAER